MLQMENVFLDYQQQELVASIDIEDKPQLNMTQSVTVPGRTLAIVCICNDLDSNQSGSLYEIEPCGMLNEKYPNLCVIPMIHNVDVHRTEHLPLVVINFASFKRRDYGFYAKYNHWKFLKL